jgi:hypothetical protein
VPPAQDTPSPTAIPKEYPGSAPAADAEACQAQKGSAEERKVGGGATSYPDAAGGQLKVQSMRTAEFQGEMLMQHQVMLTVRMLMAGSQRERTWRKVLRTIAGRNASFNNEIGTRKDS